MVCAVDRLSSDLKEAMVARDELRKNVLRSLKAEIDKECKEESAESASDDLIAKIAARQRRQRLESAEAYRKNGSDKHAEQEEAEAVVLAEYMPAQLGDEEVVRHIEEAVAEAGARSAAETGKVMAILSKRLAGKADLKEVSGKVRKRLGG